MKSDGMQEFTFSDPTGLQLWSSEFLALCGRQKAEITLHLRIRRFRQRLNRRSKMTFRGFLVLGGEGETLGLFSLSSLREHRRKFYLPPPRN